MSGLRSHPATTHGGERGEPRHGQCQRRWTRNLQYQLVLCPLPVGVEQIRHPHVADASEALFYGRGLQD